VLPSKSVSNPLNWAIVADKTYACWMGKNVGGTLGGPLEKAWGQEELFDVWWYPKLQEGGIPNDDLELQLVWLKALEEIGPGLKAADLAQYWLNHIGYDPDEYGFSKANLRRGLLPPVSGAYNNWFKDCMGCPIRSEIWACVAPGHPRVAVKYAYEDAICDHAGGESVFGEFFNVAVESAAFVESDPATLIAIGLSYVPEGNKTRQAVEAACAAHRAGVDWKEARRRVLQAAPHYNAQYSPPNIGFQVVGWLYGNDFGDALCKAVNCGYDTDCTGATLGSFLGIIGGQAGLPVKWTQPLGDNIAKGGLTCAYDVVNPVPLDLHDLTRRTLIQARRVLLAHNLLNDDGTIRQPAPADLYADAAALEIAHRPVMRIDHRFVGGTLAIGVDYIDTPAVIANSHKQIVTHLQNPQPMPITATASLQVPPGWSAPAPQTTTVPPLASVPLTWDIVIPGPMLLHNSNRLSLAVDVVQRPAVPSAPVVLIGANRFRISGPYRDEANLPPEQVDGDLLRPNSRGGAWREVWALDDAIPLDGALDNPGVLYLQTFLYSEKARKCFLGFTANCPATLWVNGKLSAQGSNYDPIRPNYGASTPAGGTTAHALVDLHAGWNEVLGKLLRKPHAPPMQAVHLILCENSWKAGIVDLGRTRLPWDV